MAVLISELVAFAVILFVLYRYVWPVVARMARARQDSIQQQVDDSEEAARRREEAQRRLDTAVAESRDEAARMRDDARADATRIREELQEQADREVERIKQRGEEQLLAQRDQTVRRLRTEIGGLSMRLAEQLIAESLSSDERRSATVDAFLVDLDGMGDGMGDGAGGGGSDRTGEGEAHPNGVDPARQPIPARGEAT